MSVSALSTGASAADDGRLFERLSWDSLRLLLHLDEAGSFRSAAVAGGVSLNTMRTKIEQLERQFGAPLVTRSVEGARMNQAGRELVSIVREMRQLTGATHRVVAAGQQRRPDVVRLTVTEGLGTYWLVPKLVTFGEEYGNLQIDLTCDMAPPDVLFRDVDLSVQLTRPRIEGLVSERLGSLHIMPFASERYLRRFGMPTSLADADGHRLVWQVADQLPVEILSRFLEPGVAEQAIAVKTNTSSAHYLAVAEGAGIGLLPTYTRALSAKVRPLDVGFQLKHDIYVVHRPELHLSAAARAVLGWLREAFDGARYPWFADAFVHPDDFPKRDASATVLPMFEHLDT